MSPGRAAELIETVPILALSGHSAGPSTPKPAWASVQALCPSAASGLIVSPWGRVRTEARISDGEAAKPWVWGAPISSSRPEGESASELVRRAWTKGLKLWRMQTSIGGGEGSGGERRGGARVG